MRVTYMISLNHDVPAQSITKLHAYKFAAYPRNPAQTRTFPRNATRKFGLSRHPAYDRVDHLPLGELEGVVVEGTAAVERRDLVRGVGILLGRRPDHVEQHLWLDRLQRAGGDPALHRLLARGDPAGERRIEEVLDHRRAAHD